MEHGWLPLAVGPCATPPSYFPWRMCIRQKFRSQCPLQGPGNAHRQNNLDVTLLLRIQACGRWKSAQQPSERGRGKRTPHDPTTDAKGLINYGRQTGGCVVYVEKGFIPPPSRALAPGPLRRSAGNEAPVQHLKQAMISSPPGCVC